MEIIDKIVNFEFCKTCVHSDEKECDEPCHECLDNPVNQHTTKPLKYVEDEKKVKELENDNEK